jgi:hypothetical protein
VNENRVGADWEVITETLFKGDVWIQKSCQHLLIKKKSMKTESVSVGKSSPKHFSKVMRGFGITAIPC